MNLFGGSSLIWLSPSRGQLAIAIALERWDVTPSPAELPLAAHVTAFLSPGGGNLSGLIPSRGLASHMQLAMPCCHATGLKRWNTASDQAARQLATHMDAILRPRWPVASGLAALPCVATTTANKYGE